MALDLSKDLVFNVAGALLPNNGEIPNFQRASRAYTPYIEGRSWYLKEGNIHEPRFLFDGSLLLEPATVNLIENPTVFNKAPWEKGSAVSINPDVLQGLSKNYLADVIGSTGAATTSISGTLSQSVYLQPGVYTLSLYISKISGIYTSADRISIINGNLSVNGELSTNELAGISLTEYWGAGQPFEKDNKKWKRIILQFAIGGTSQSTLSGNLNDLDSNLTINDVGATPLATEGNNKVTIAIILNGGSSVTALAGIQLEAHPFPTSFIEATSGNPTRAADSLRYPNSPFTAKARGGATDTDAYDWTCKLTLTSYEGDGNIFYCGNIRADIQDGRLVVQVGAFQLADPFLIKRNCQIIIRHKANHSIRLYVDYELRAQYKLNNITVIAKNAPLIFSSTGVRLIREFYVFSWALPDEIPLDPIVLADGNDDPFLAVPIPGMLNCLNLIDYELPVSESKGRILFTPISLYPNQTAFIRFPQVRRFSEPILDITPSAGTAAKQVRVEVLSYGGQNLLDQYIQESITVSGLTFTARTLKSAPDYDQMAADFAAEMTASLTDLTVNYVSGTTFTLTARTPGRGFIVSASTGIGLTTLTPNGQDFGEIVIDSPAEFLVGRAQVYRNYIELCEIEIHSIVQFTDPVDSEIRGRLTFSTYPTEASSKLAIGDIVFQPSFSTLIAPGNYYADTLEDYDGVRVVLKGLNGFSIQNTTGRTLTITPLAKLFF